MNTESQTTAFQTLHLEISQADQSQRSVQHTSAQLIALRTDYQHLLLKEGVDLWVYTLDLEHGHARHGYATDHQCEATVLFFGKKIYWKDHGKDLRRGKEVNKKLTVEKVVDHNCIATDMAVNGEQIFWVDEDTNWLRQGVDNGQLVQQHILSKDWPYQLIAAADGYVFGANRGDNKIVQFEIVDQQLRYIRDVIYQGMNVSAITAGLGHLLWIQNGQVAMGKY